MKGLNHTERVAVFVPAYNEKEVIEQTLESIVKIVGSGNLYVVDDGSTDGTSEIAKKFTKHVVTIKNGGKANALNFGVKHFRLTQKYDFILFMDADTSPDSKFLEYSLPHFRDDLDQKVVCVVGRVKGYNGGWISKYRQWEYQISHLIHKKAQQILKCILVVPGCATIYRSNIFNKLSFPTGTLTEDMDFTFLLHRKDYNNMIFERRSIVRTQDPDNLSDFMKQLVRWYTGFWQVVRKHDVPWHGQFLDIEVAMLAMEGLYNGFLVLFFVISVLPISFFGNLSVFRLPFLIDFFIFFLPSLIWSILADKDYIRIFYIPHFYFLRFLSSTVFLYSFFRGFLSIEKDYTWNTNRYIQKEEVV